MLKIAERSVGLAMIAQRRAAGGDGFLKDIPNGAPQPFSPFGGRSIVFDKIAGWPIGREAGSVERFADIDIAKPGYEFLIQQGRFERGLSSSE